MQNAGFVDRRIFERIPTDLSMRFLAPHYNKEGLVQVRDISAKGLGLVTHEELPSNTSLEMWLQMPDKGESLYTRGEVVWSKMLEPNKYRMGISLERADFMGLSRILRRK